MNYINNTIKSPLDEILCGNKELTYLIESGIIAREVVEEKIIELNRKDKKMKIISLIGKEPKIYHHNDGKRIFSKIKINGKWKQIFAYDEDTLLDHILAAFNAPDTVSLETIYPSFMIYRRDMNKVSSKTLTENANDWKKFLANNPISKINLCKLRTKDFIIFFEELTKDRFYTHKAISNLKSLLNKMYAYAIREDLVSTNPIKEIDFNDFNYRIPEKKGGVYSVKNRQKLLNYLSNINEPYSLAIQLDFQLTCRIGEIKALSWKNVDFENNRIYINSQALNERILQDDLTFGKREINVVNRTKGNTPNGKRYIPMTSIAKDILYKAKQLNPEGEYVFMPFGKLMLTDTFNEYLAKYCKAAGVPYFSSHKIRFTSCSLLYNGDNLAQVSKLMGHSETATTLHYLRDVYDTDKMLDTMENAFSIVSTK